MSLGPFLGGFVGLWLGWCLVEGQESSGFCTSTLDLSYPQLNCLAGRLSGLTINFPRIKLPTDPKRLEGNDVFFAGKRTLVM